MNIDRIQVRFQLRKTNTQADKGPRALLFLCPQALVVIQQLEVA